MPLAREGAPAFAPLLPVPAMPVASEPECRAGSVDASSLAVDLAGELERGSRGEKDEP